MTVHEDDSYSETESQRGGTGHPLRFCSDVFIPFSRMHSHPTAYSRFQ